MILMIFAPDQKLFVFIKWGIMRGGKRVAHTRRREKHKAFCLGNLQDGTHFEDLGADGRIILQLVFQKYCRRF